MFIHNATQRNDVCVCWFAPQRMDLVSDQTVQANKGIKYQKQNKTKHKQHLRALNTNAMDSYMVRQHFEL